MGRSFRLSKDPILGSTSQLARKSKPYYCQVPANQNRQIQQEAPAAQDSNSAPQPHTAIQQLAQLYDLVFDDDSSSDDYEVNPPIPSGHLDNLVDIETSSEDEHSELSITEVEAPAQGKKITVADLMRSVEACSHPILSSMTRVN